MDRIDLYGTCLSLSILMEFRKYFPNDIICMIVQSCKYGHKINIGNDISNIWLDSCRKNKYMGDWVDISCNRNIYIEYKYPDEKDMFPMYSLVFNELIRLKKGYEDLNYATYIDINNVGVRRNNKCLDDYHIEIHFSDEIQRSLTYEDYKSNCVIYEIDMDIKNYDKMRSIYNDERCYWANDNPLKNYIWCGILFGVNYTNVDHKMIGGGYNDKERTFYFVSC